MGFRYLEANLYRWKLDFRPLSGNEERTLLGGCISTTFMLNPIRNVMLVHCSELNCPPLGVYVIGSSTVYHQHRECMGYYKSRNAEIRNWKLEIGNKKCGNQEMLRSDSLMLLALLVGPHWRARALTRLTGIISSASCNLEFDFSAVAKMCDKEIEVIDLTLCGSSDEEEDPVKNSKASCSSPVLISSDLDLEDFEPAFEYVRHRAGLNNPLALFTTNCSESLNNVIKMEVDWKESKLPLLVEHLWNICNLLEIAKMQSWREQ